jgi:hypothetical protein
MVRDHDHLNAAPITATSSKMRWKVRDASVGSAFIFRATGRWRGRVLRRNS